jgi:hypothetical protein
LQYQYYFILYTNVEKYIVNDYYSKPDRKHCALLVIDVQQDFTLVGATAEIAGTLQAVQYMRRLILEYRA